MASKFLPENVQLMIQSQITPKCYKALFEKFQFDNTECIKLLLSKLIGIGIVLGASLVKVPQILKIVMNGSVKGLSLSSYLLETAGFLISLAYNYRNGFPFSTFGESLFVTIQNCFIIGLMLSYHKRYDSLLLLLIGVSVISYALFHASLVSNEQLKYLQTFNIPVSILSKLPQIVTNYQTKSTGQLSSITVFLFFLGSLARVFTTMQEVNDYIILWGFILATFLNGLLALQMILYWNQPEKKKKY